MYLNGYWHMLGFNPESGCIICVQMIFVNCFEVNFLGRQDIGFGAFPGWARDVKSRDETEMLRLRRDVQISRRDVCRSRDVTKTLK